MPTLWALVGTPGAAAQKLSVNALSAVGSVAAENFAVVVMTGYGGDDFAWIVHVGPVEFVTVLLLLLRAVNDITQMQEERRIVHRAVRMVVLCHTLRNLLLHLILVTWSAGIAHRMKANRSTFGNDD